VNRLLSYSILKLEMFPDKLMVIATERLPQLDWAYKELGRIQGMHFITHCTDTKILQGRPWLASSIIRQSALRLNNLRSSLWFPLLMLLLPLVLALFI